MTTHPILTPYRMHLSMCNSKYWVSPRVFSRRMPQEQHCALGYSQRQYLRQIHLRFLLCLCLIIPDRHKRTHGFVCIYNVNI